MKLYNCICFFHKKSEEAFLNISELENLETISLEHLWTMLFICVYLQHASNDDSLI